jgi:hypothetical protein
MATCRSCGVECAPEDLRALHEGGGCRSCNGSPACARCGHARRHHRGTFGRGAAGCTARVTPDTRLAVGRCRCEGYTRDAAAFADRVDVVDVVELRLRRPGESLADGAAQLEPVRDLFDESRRVRSLPEARPLPWRPPG